MEARTHSEKRFFKKILDKLNDFVLNNKNKMHDKSGKLTREGNTVAEIAKIVINYFQLPIKVDDILSEKNLARDNPTLFSLDGMQQPSSREAPNLFRTANRNIRAILTSLSTKDKLRSAIYPLVDNTEEPKNILKQLQQNAGKEKEDKKEKESEKENEEEVDYAIELKGISTLPVEILHHIIRDMDTITKSQLGATARLFKQVTSDDRFWKKEVEDLVGNSAKAEKARLVSGSSEPQTYHQTYLRLVKENPDEVWKQKIRRLGVNPNDARKNNVDLDRGLTKETYQQAYQRILKEKEIESENEEWKVKIRELGEKDPDKARRNNVDLDRGLTKETYQQAYERLRKEKERESKDAIWKEKIILELGEKNPDKARKKIFDGDHLVIETYQQTYERLLKEKDEAKHNKPRLF